MRASLLALAKSIYQSFSVLSSLFVSLLVLSRPYQPFYALIIPFLSLLVLFCPYQSFSVFTGPFNQSFSVLTSPFMSLSAFLFFLVLQCPHQSFYLLSSLVLFYLVLIFFLITCVLSLFPYLSFSVRIFMPLCGPVLCPRKSGERD